MFEQQTEKSGGLLVVTPPEDKTSISQLTPGLRLRRRPSHGSKITKSKAAPPARGHHGLKANLRCSHPLVFLSFGCSLNLLSCVSLAPVIARLSTCGDLQHSREQPDAVQ